MEDVFLSEVDLEGGDDWKTVNESEMSYMIPTTADNETDILAVQMDISSPLSTLKTILGNRLGADLTQCELWLQDVVQLSDETTTLADQCIQGEGMVQVNLELKLIENVNRINIIDVLKPQLDGEVTLEEAILENKEDSIEVPQIPATAPVLEQNSTASVVLETGHASNSVQSNTGTLITPANTASLETQVQMRKLTASKVTYKLPTPQNENITRWVMDGNFRKEQEKLKIPLDPINWSHDHVKIWLNWAIHQFNLKSINPSQWANVDGTSLCNMTHTEFTTRIPRNPLSKDPNHDLFWTHLELLRKCKFVGVIQKPVPYLQYITTPLTVKSDSSRMPRTPLKVTPTKRNPLETFTTRSFHSATPGNRTGTNGQIQLWQFLLELLTDRNFRDAISWLGTGGEFKLNNPEMVAQLWGERKNKPHMNYEKLSRALRYYYDGDMICKVSGKRFVYKFVCDLKSLLGYNAEELNKLVTECEQRSKMGRAPSSYV